MLSIKNLTVGVGKKTILKNFNFDFQKGKVYAVMGPNGSGKSTLAYTIMGHPTYKVEKGSLKLEGNDITEKKADERSKMGIFLSFQSPLSLGGVRVYQLLQLAVGGQKGALEVRKNADSVASELKINPELMTRSLNEGASGGEKKKLEVLQAVVLDKNIVIFDEVDTGVDIDSLKTISKFLHKHKNGKTYIVITHYNRILKYLKPDKVLVLIDGKLKKVGDSKLANEIEKNGYGSF